MTRTSDVRDKIRPGSLDAIFRPSSVAVIGATPRKGTIGRQILHNLINYEFTGSIFPVNPKHSVVHSFKCYPSVLDIPDAVSLAFIIVPRDSVLHVVDQCAQKGVKGVVVITAGFKEIGSQGAHLEAQLLERLRDHGIRMIGPNCFGIVNTDSRYRVNGTFGKPMPRPGRIAFVSQSGALGETILTHAEEMGIGFSMFASIGNKTDVSGNDVLEYWRDDPNTDVILMYLESFGDPRKFTEIAREVTLKKPIIVVKSGRSAAGAKAALSHTGSLAGQDVSVDALFAQSGVIRVTTIQEMFDAAMAFVTQPAPRGRRVCVVTNAGGPGILATDALVAEGLELSLLSEDTKQKLREHLPDQASVENPVDLIASADADRYGVALDIVAADPSVDTLVPIFVPPLMIDAEAVADKLIEVSERHSKPMLPCMMGVSQGATWISKLKNAGLPVYPYPENIAHTLRALEHWRVWLKRPRGTIPQLKVDLQAAQELMADARDGLITERHALLLLDAYGIPVASLSLAHSADEAVNAATKCGYPVALKLASGDILHKSDVGGVRINVGSAEDVREQFDSIRDRLKDHSPKAQFSGVHVQAMISGGTELAIGMSTDPGFGPLLMFGMGGVFVEVLNDVVFRVHPLTDIDAEEMLRQIRGYPLLTGARGGRPVDLDKLALVMLRLSKLVTDFPQIDQIDINPLIAGADSCELAAVDARIILHPQPS